MFVCTPAIALPFYHPPTSHLSCSDSDPTRCAESESGVRNRGTQALFTSVRTLQCLCARQPSHYHFTTRLLHTSHAPIPTQLDALNPNPASEIRVPRHGSPSPRTLTSCSNFSITSKSYVLKCVINKLVFNVKKLLFCVEGLDAIYMRGGLLEQQ